MNRVLRYRAYAALPHAVYRYWDANGVLLYVGCSMQPEERWKQWLGKSGVDWPRQTVRRELTWYDDRASGRYAEDCAIGEERPAHNARGGADGGPRIRMCDARLAALALR